jgi:4'-phosphopantetheinyl transferase
MPGLDRVRIAWDRVDPGDRRLTSRRLLRMLDPALTEIRSGPCPRCGGAHGRLTTPGRDTGISVTYAGGLAIVAVLPEAAGAAIGVDAQAGTAGDQAAMDGVRPGTTVREWTRIEAALKADGRGLAVDPGRVRLEDQPDGWRAIVPGRGAPILGVDVDGPAGLVVSLAMIPAAAAAARAGRATA